MDGFSKFKHSQKGLGGNKRPGVTFWLKILTSTRVDYFKVQSSYWIYKIPIFRFFGMESIKHLFLKNIYLNGSKLLFFFISMYYFVIWWPSPHVIQMGKWLHFLSPSQFCRTCTKPSNIARIVSLDHIDGINIKKIFSTAFSISFQFLLIVEIIDGAQNI